MSAVGGTAGVAPALELGATRTRQVRRRRAWPAPLTAGVAIVGTLALLAALAPLLTPFEPTKLDMASALQPPGREHWFGTDHLGRDVFTRVLYGARLSLMVGIFSVLPAAIFGLAAGIAAGSIGGWVDEIGMRVTDVLLAFPILILAMGISVAMGRSLSNAVIAMAIVLWPGYIRLARAQTFSVRHREYIEAARAIGASPGRVLRRHFLPNCLDPIVVQASVDIGVAIIVVASLSFLGLGAQPPTPEWGAMVLEGKMYLRDAWWISTFSGLAIFAAVYGSTLIGDGLRDWLDRARR